MTRRRFTVRDPRGGSFDLVCDDADQIAVDDNGEYDPGVMRQIAALLPRDGVALDVGAHIGILTVVMAGCAVDGQVYAFEPTPVSAACLRDNVASLGFSNVEVHEVAMHEQRGSTAFVVDASYPAGARMTETSSATAAITVAMHTIDEWSAEAEVTRLDLVKLDVEGAELAVLRGAAVSLERWKPSVIVECNPVTLHGSIDSFYAELRRYGRFIGRIRSDGTVARIRMDSHLRLALADEGICNLLLRTEGPRGYAWLRDEIRRVRDHKRLARRWRSGEAVFAFDPQCDVALGLDAETVARGDVLHGRVQVRNRSSVAWSSTHARHPINLGYRWFSEDGRCVSHDGPRVSFEPELRPGRSSDFEVAVSPPAVPGRYRLSVAPVQEGYAWFDDVLPASSATAWVEVT